MSSTPKAVLYFNPKSAWSSVVLLALAEKGYGPDEIDLRTVNIAAGENFAPSFLRLNPKATIPTLVVPLQSTLAEDVESRYRAITETTAILEFLDKSRSPLSQTHTTSTAPAPSLSPATIAFVTLSKTVIEELLHSADADPNILKRTNATDDASLAVLAQTMIPFHSGRLGALDQYLRDAERKGGISDKVKAFWRKHKIEAEELLDVFQQAGTESGKLEPKALEKRSQFLQAAEQAWQTSLRSTLERLDKVMIGPLVLGEQLSLADLHLAGWLARVLSCVGVETDDDGSEVVKKLTARIPKLELPDDFTVEETKGIKLAAFWDSIRDRPSFRKVYAEGLH